MKLFIPFANDNQSLNLGELTLENQGEQVNLYGSMTLTLDKQSLEQAKQLQALLTQAIDFLQSNGAEKIEKSVLLARQKANETDVVNPFA